jgi:hypothetical protein
MSCAAEVVAGIAAVAASGTMDEAERTVANAEKATDGRAREMFEVQMGHERAQELIERAQKGVIRRRRACSQEQAAQCWLLRDLFGNPFRPAPAIDPVWLRWRGGLIPQLAQALYDERVLPAGTFDPARLSLLADMLTDAGCTDPDILGHVRGGGDHVRGCWLVDSVLGKK